MDRLTSLKLAFPYLEKDMCELFLYDKSHARGYLGCSILGHPCDRLLWYHCKRISAPEPQIKTAQEVKKTLKKFLRFQVGYKLEELIIELLKKSHCSVAYEQEEISFLKGKVKGHIDGIIHESPLGYGRHYYNYVLEIKSMNDQRFKLLQKKKVKEGFPEYWAQCQLYMKGIKLNQALFLAINKNTCEIYHEIIPYNKKDAEGLLLKAQRIFEYDSEPSIFTQPGRKIPLVCSGCDYFDHCYKETIKDEKEHNLST